MSATTKTKTTTEPVVLPALLDSSLLRADLEGLLEALRQAEFWAEPAGADGVRLERRRWERVVECYDDVRQSLPLALARLRSGGVGE